MDTFLLLLLLFSKYIHSYSSSDDRQAFYVRSGVHFLLNGLRYVRVRVSTYSFVRTPRTSLRDRFVNCLLHNKCCREPTTWFCFGLDLWLLHVVPDYHYCCYSNELKLLQSLKLHCFADRHGVQLGLQNFNKAQRTLPWPGLACPAMAVTSFMYFS